MVPGKLSLFRAWERLAKAVVFAVPDILGLMKKNVAMSQHEQVEKNSATTVLPVCFVFWYLRLVCRFYELEDTDTICILTRLWILGC